MIGVILLLFIFTHTDIIPSEHVDRWKLKFRSLNIPKQLCLSLVVDWAREADCSHDHKFIANCLHFLDSEAQVSSTNLSPNILYYLPTCYRFVTQRINNQDKDSLNPRQSNPQEDPKDYSEVKGSDASVYSSPIQNVDSDVEGSHSFISSSFNPLSILAGHSKKEETHNSPTLSRETTKDNEIIVGTNLDIHIPWRLTRTLLPEEERQI